MERNIHALQGQIRAQESDADGLGDWGSSVVTDGANSALSHNICDSFGEDYEHNLGEALSSADERLIEEVIPPLLIEHGLRLKPKAWVELWLDLGKPETYADAEASWMSRRVPHI